ncbi:MAG: GNAT family N-acetyltransferase [Cyclobacteriaceae bacterium]|jgi:hypothetical protein|nr:GNAT family N-acetyltransferase [Cyclobacteriaceae bacterium]
MAGVLPTYVYNHPAYRPRAATGQSISYTLAQAATIHALIHFQLEDERAINGYRAPFGGIECEGPVGLAEMRTFLAQAVADLQKRGIRHVQITLPPDLYQPEKNALLAEALRHEGFGVSARDVSSVLSIDGRPYSERLHPRKRRKLRAVDRHDLLFRPWPAHDLEEAFTFIQQQRQKKNYRLSVTLAHLQKSVEQLPAHYRAFGVWTPRELVAASIAVRASGHVLYHFLSDHDRATAHGSAALVLMEGLYQFCQQHRYTLLDLGTSMQGSQADEALVRFKTELGAVTCDRLTFAREI